MERFDLLPLIHEGARVKQVSGFDRTGGNDDGFNGTYSTLYIDENNEYVMFDEIGAGCVYRFWMTYDHSVFGGPEDYDQNILRFYYDNEETPRLEITIDDFFDGTGAPFEFPLVGRWQQSSHGCYCYVPFPYKERLKITLSRKPFFYNITYHRFDHGEDVVSWTGNEDQSAVMGQWNNPGRHLCPAEYSETNALIVSLQAGETGEVYSAATAGLIETIRLDPSIVNQEALQNVWLDINFDGGSAEVHVPIGDFFGCGYGEKEIAALPIGMKTNGFWYCNFPMPYWESALVKLVNNSASDIEIPLQVVNTSNTFDRAEAGYFCARFNERTFVADKEDYCFIDEAGRGHLVGVSLRMHGTGTSGWRGMTFLEGDERAYIDGARSPAIHGTGNEDYFNAGWYFDQGTFSRPYHGCTHRVYDWGLKENFFQAYRFHLSDTIPFYNSIKFGIEHGPGNSEPGTFSSVAYYYLQHDDGFGSGLQMIADLDLGDEWVEGLYDYSTTGTTIFNVLRYMAEGESISSSGYCETNLSFRLPLVENSGVLLRRKIDMGAGPQNADVYVDGQFAGCWYEPDLNYTNSQYRWIDSEFQIPTVYIKNKDAVIVEVVPSSDVSPLTSDLYFNSYHLWAWAVCPLEEVPDIDGDGMPDDWELRYFTFLETLSATTDFDGDGLLDSEEFIAGTNPTNSLSGFSIDSSGRIRFLSQPGRFYTLEHSTNLVGNSWNDAFSDLLGTGREVIHQVDGLLPCAYYRLSTQAPGIGQ